MYYFMDSGPKFTGLVWLHAGGIARDHVSFRFLISCLVPEIFAIKVGSCEKSVQILHVFGTPIFLGEGPRIFGPGLSNRGRYWSRGKVSWRSDEGARRSCVWLKNIKNITTKTEGLWN